MNWSPRCGKRPGSGDHSESRLHAAFRGLPGRARASPHPGFSMDGGMLGSDPESRKRSFDTLRMQNARHGEDNPSTAAETILQPQRRGLHPRMTLASRRGWREFNVRPATPRRLGHTWARVGAYGNHLNRLAGRRRNSAMLVLARAHPRGRGRHRPHVAVTTVVQLHHPLDAIQPGLEPARLPFELREFAIPGVAGSRLGSAWAGHQSRQLSPAPRRAPGRQVRGVQALAPQQRAELARAGARVRRTQHAQLLVGRVLSPPGFCHPLGLLRHRDVLHPCRGIGTHPRHSTTHRTGSTSPSHDRNGV